MSKVREIIRKNQMEQMLAQDKEPNKNGTSGKCGVSWSERRNRWRGYVTHNRKTTWVGEFKDKDTAVKAVNECRALILEAEVGES